MKQKELNKYSEWFKNLQKEDKASKNKVIKANNKEEEAKKVLRQIRDIFKEEGYYNK